MNCPFKMFIYNYFTIDRNYDIWLLKVIIQYTNFLKKVQFQKQHYYIYVVVKTSIYKSQALTIKK